MTESKTDREKLIETLDALDSLFREAKNANNIKPHTVENNRLILTIELPLNLSNRVRAVLSFKDEQP